MSPTRITVLALSLFAALSGAACSKPGVKISVDPKQMNQPGPVEVSWETKDLEATTITSNPPVSGLPKAVTGSDSGKDTFKITATTTFQITGLTKGQNGPFTKTSAATATVLGQVR